MSVSTVCKYAAMRLGADEEAAERMMALLRAKARSEEAFREWDGRICQRMAQAMIRGMSGEPGRRRAEEVVQTFRQGLISRCSPPERLEVSRLLFRCGLW